MSEICLVPNKNVFIRFLKFAAQKWYNVFNLLLFLIYNAINIQAFLKKKCRCDCHSTLKFFAY